MKQNLSNDCSASSAMRIYSVWQNQASVRPYKVIHPWRLPAAQVSKNAGWQGEDTTYHLLQLVVWKYILEMQYWQYTETHSSDGRQLKVV